MDKNQIKYLRLNIEHELLINQRSDEMREINVIVDSSIDTIEREMIWQRLQPSGVSQNTRLVLAHLRSIRKLSNVDNFKRFKLMVPEVDN